MAITRNEPQWHFPIRSTASSQPGLADRDSDEVAWVLAGQFTFKIGDEVAVGGPGTCAFMPRNVPHAWNNTGSETGRVLFLYTPAAAGGLIEALSERLPTDDVEYTKLFERLRWELVGPK